MYPWSPTPGGGLEAVCSAQDVATAVPSSDARRGEADAGRFDVLDEIRRSYAAIGIFVRRVALDCPVWMHDNVHKNVPRVRAVGVYKLQLCELGQRTDRPTRQGGRSTNTNPQLSTQDGLWP
jgi:hypothetical protein